MRLIKSVPALAFAAVAFAPASAMAQQWVVNCGSNRCMDATQMAAGGRVQVSNCSAKNPELRGQQWDANKPKSGNIQNRWIADSNSKNGCLDVFVSSGPDEVRTNECNDQLQAQKWIFQQNQNGNLISNFFTHECLEDVSGIHQGTVEPRPCDWTNLSQRWKWVNVGDTRLGCPPM